MAEELTRKKGGIGSGNMSTPATTSSNASGSGYGYAPLYEALAQSLGYADSASAMAAAAMDTGTGTPATTETDVTSSTAGATTVDAETAANAKAFADNPTLLGTDIQSAGVGFLVSTLLGGGIPGLIGSTVGKQVFKTVREKVQLENYLKSISDQSGSILNPAQVFESNANAIHNAKNNPIDPVTVPQLSPVTEPADAITAVTEAAVNPPPVSGVKVAEEDDDPLGTWISENIPSSGTSQTSTPSQGPNTGVGSGFNSASWGNYSSGSDSGGSDSSSSSSSSD